MASYMPDDRATDNDDPTPPTPEEIRQRVADILSEREAARERAEFMLKILKAQKEAAQ